MIENGNRWKKFVQENDKPNKYEFKYRARIDHRMPPVVGIKWICCNSGDYDELPDDIENLDEKTWNIVQKNLIEDASNHGYWPCMDKKDEAKNK